MTKSYKLTLYAPGLSWFSFETTEKNLYGAGVTQTKQKNRKKAEHKQHKTKHHKNVHCPRQHRNASPKRYWVRKVYYSSAFHSKSNRIVASGAPSFPHLRPLEAKAYLWVLYSTA